jgi:hypothetical protein
MHSHAATCLKGPVSRTRTCWKKGQREERVGRGATARKQPAEGAIRQELVERVRREIAAGTYETPEKWEAALDRFLDRHLPQ